MLNFSSVSNNSLLGKSLRSLLKLIPAGATVRVLRGPLVGWKWVKGSGVNGYWLGTYEKDEQDKFIANIKEGDVVFDVGAHVGFYTLLASKLVGPRGRVFSFEASPANYSALRKHLEINHRTNVLLFNAAILDVASRVFFKETGNTSTGFVTEKPTGLEIEAYPIDDFCRERFLCPSVVKIDIEGAELRALTGAADTFKKCRPKIFLGTHSDDLFAACKENLESIGYRVETLNDPKIGPARDIFAEPVADDSQWKFR